MTKKDKLDRPATGWKNLYFFLLEGPFLDLRFLGTLLPSCAMNETHEA